MNPDNYAVYGEEDVCCFMLYNPAGVLVGYQQYRPNVFDKKSNDPKESRYFTYLPKGIDGVFGIEQDSGKGPLFIVEGIFKAARLHDLGYNAVAVLGATPKRLKTQFRIWKATRRLIALGDNDSAGSSLVRLVGTGETTPIDLDEMLTTDILEIVEKYT